MIWTNRSPGVVFAAAFLLLVEALTEAIRPLVTGGGSAVSLGTVFPPFAAGRRADALGTTSKLKRL